MQFCCLTTTSQVLILSTFQGSSEFTFITSLRQHPCVTPILKHREVKLLAQVPQPVLGSWVHTQAGWPQSLCTYPLLSLLHCGLSQAHKCLFNWLQLNWAKGGLSDL